MNLTTTTSRISVAAITVGLAGAALAVVSPADAAPEMPPPWEHCAYAEHPVAADLGGILSPHHVPTDELSAVLHGEVEVGTDCSIYDPTLPNP